jgi:hypothetical protein
MDNATPDGGAVDTGAPFTMDSAASALAALRERPQAAPTEESTEEIPEVTTETPAVEEEQPASESQETEQESETPEGTEPQIDVQSIAKALGVAPEDLVIDSDGQLAIKTKIDGEDGKAKLADFRKSYQLESSFTNKSMRLAEERKEFERQTQAAVQQYQQQKQQLQNDLQVVTHLLQGQYADPQYWAKLQAEDPVAYLAEKDRYQGYMQAVNGIQQQFQQEQLRQQQQQQAQFQEWVKSQQQELLNHIPEWKDQGAFKKELSEIESIAKADYGLTPEDLQQVYDNRHVRILRDAIRYRKLQAQKTTVMQKVNKAPNIAKPGSTQPASKNKEQEVHERFGKTHSVKDAAAALGLLRTKNTR